MNESSKTIYVGLDVHKDTIERRARHYYRGASLRWLRREPPGHMADEVLGPQSRFDEVLPIASPPLRQLSSPTHGSAAAASAASRGRL